MKYEYIFMFMKRVATVGFGIWLGATVVLRFAGQYIIPATAGGIVLLFAISFPAMALLTRRVSHRFGLARKEWPVAAIALAAPTLALDPFTSAFFSQVFPNVRPELAGVFGGWMLCCVAGAVFGGVL